MPFNCGSVTGVARTENRLAVGTKNGSLRLFGLTAGRPTLTWRLGRVYAEPLALSDDGHYLYVRELDVHDPLVGTSIHEQEPAIRVYELDADGAIVGAGEVFPPELDKQWSRHHDYSVASQGGRVVRTGCTVISGPHPCSSEVRERDGRSLAKVSHYGR